ncbi:unnamed protein product, partial [Meganyctiphanes norvegica]
LECKICHVPYNEEEHRPRNALCGHEICTACVKALIKDNILECPTCRQKNTVKVPEDLTINFGLIDVIRAFKTNHISWTKKNEPNVSGATNDEICKVHYKAISHWCFKCQDWICTECLEYHSTLVGCTTAISSKAIENIKEKHNKNIDEQLNVFEENANYLKSKRQEHLKLAEKHGAEAEKLNTLLEEGNFHKEKLIESKTHLGSANSPHAVSDRVKVLTQRKQMLHSWSVKNLGTDILDIRKNLAEEKGVYAEMVIKNEKRHAKLSEHEKGVYFHSFIKEVVADDCICIHFDQLQKSISDASLLFFELSVGGIKKGCVLVRLDKTLPNISENILQIVTGQHGPTLRWEALNNKDNHNIRAIGLPFKEIPVTLDPGAKSTAKYGDVIGNFGCGFLATLFFYVATQSPKYFGKNYGVFGNVVDGMDIIHECHDKFSQGVLISDCGIIIEHE